MLEQTSRSRLKIRYWISLSFTLAEQFQYTGFSEVLGNTIANSKLIWAFHKAIYQRCVVFTGKLPDYEKGQNWPMNGAEIPLRVVTLTNRL